MLKLEDKYLALKIYNKEETKSKDIERIRVEYNCEFIELPISALKSNYFFDKFILNLTKICEIKKL